MCRISVVTARLAVIHAWQREGVTGGVRRNKPVSGGVARMDPVSRFQQHQQAWKRGAAPVTGRRSPLPESVRSVPMERPVTPRGRSRVTSEYVVPTTKRRDSLRSAVHDAMRTTSKLEVVPSPRIPNTYVPPTHRRRDQVVWDTRVTMHT